MTDNALSIQVRLSAPNKVETQSAEFDAGTTTTELSVETEDNDLVDYPSERDYMVEVLGDGYIYDRDDEIYTPGNPSQATVSVTDNDELQIVTIHPQEAFVKEGGVAKYVFRRTGDTSKELPFTYVRTKRYANSTGYLTYTRVDEQFEAGAAEKTTVNLLSESDSQIDQVVNDRYPLVFAAQVYGDGQLYGLHQIWKAGDPDTATIVYYDDDRERALSLQAEYPSSGRVGQAINIDFTVLNNGSLNSGATITISSKQSSRGSISQPSEPRVSCTISGALATGKEGTCQATFTLTDQDLTDSPMVLLATASDGTTTSGPV